MAAKRYTATSESTLAAGRRADAGSMATWPIIPRQALVRKLAFHLVYTFEKVLYYAWLAVNDRPLALLEASP